MLNTKSEDCMQSIITYTESNGIICDIGGVVSGKDLIEFNAEIYSEPEKTKQIVYQIVDFTRVEKIDVSIDDLREVSQQDSDAIDINQNMLIAIVGSNKTQKALTAIWQSNIYDFDTNTNFFFTRDEAYEWIYARIESRSLEATE